MGSTLQRVTFPNLVFFCFLYTFSFYESDMRTEKMPYFVTQYQNTANILKNTTFAVTILHNILLLSFLISSFTSLI